MIRLAAWCVVLVTGLHGCQGGEIGSGGGSLDVGADVAIDVAGDTPDDRLAPIDAAADSAADAASDASADDTHDISPDVREDVVDVGGMDVGADAPSTGSAGCRSGGGLAEGEYQFTLEDRDRRFILRLPTDYTSERAWPLVLALHGNGGSAGYWDVESGARNIRGVLAHHAILIIAEAIEGNWRDYQAQDQWEERIDSELLYFEEVLSLARAELCIQEQAIFAMGFSGGGSFSGLLGCRRTDIRAIAVGGSVLYFDPSVGCVGNPAAWITIGALELTGGREDYRDFFAQHASCQGSTTPTDPDPCVAYDGCAPDTPVHYCQHPGDHVWPDFASQAAWDFFSRFVP